MGFLKNNQVEEIKSKIVTDPSTLGKIYRSRKNEYLQKSIDHNLVDDYVKEGWVEVASLKTKTKIQKRKQHSKILEDDIWCMLYELGYRMLNFDDQFYLPYSKDKHDKKQIDVIAIDDESILIIECKSSKEPRKAPSYKEEFDSLSLRINGYKKSLHQVFGDDKKVKYIFATRNLRIPENSEDIKRLKNTNSFHLNDNAYKYIINLISKYKNASKFQFFGLIFKNELINKNEIEIPALNGKMGGKNYYMFSIEPSLLLKMGFVLHRTKANESEFPTYQRLLVPSRLSGITKFIDEGGYFPNSIIINFTSNSSKYKIHFDPHSRNGDTHSRTGMLRIPNVYGIAYIIDGQHRVYGYANSEHLYNTTIPVVALDNLDTSEQLEMFMDINQNQKAVSPNLRLDLEEYLYWNSDRADSRMKALRSSIIKKLANSTESPLYNLISVGEDSAQLAFKPFASAISNSGLLPIARGNKYDESSLVGSLYDTSNHNHNDEMQATKKKVYETISSFYELVMTEYPQFIRDKDGSLIASNRGTYAFICLIGSLNRFLTEEGKIDRKTTTDKRYRALEKYIRLLLDNLRKMPVDEKDAMLSQLGAGADIEWLRAFQSKVSEGFEEYKPEELIDWKQRKNKNLQSKGSNLIDLIEGSLKENILKQLNTLFGENWEYEIGSIKSECQSRADQENQQNYREGINSTKVKWTDKFTITDYRTIISKHWTAKISSEKNSGTFLPFEEMYSINIDSVGKNKSDRIKWLLYLNAYRKKVAHHGTIGVGLNQEEVEFLDKVAIKLGLKTSQ